MAAIDRTSPMPLWAQVLDDLRTRLSSGELTDVFPTDLELTQQYGVARQTAREAVRRLQAEGIVSRQRGRGTFVTSPTIEQPTGALYSLFRSIEGQGREQRSEVLDLSLTTDGPVAERLGLSPRSEFVRLERLRYIDTHVLAHDTAWLPAELARPLLGVDFSHTALYDELSNRCAVRPTSGTEWIGTEVPGRAERELLGIGAKQSVFRIRRLSHEGDRAIEWRETVVRGDRYLFVAQWSPASAYRTVLTSADAKVDAA